MVEITQRAEGRTVPQDLEAERSVLGSLLLDGELFTEVDFLEPDDFYLLRHQRIHEVLKGLAMEHAVTDPITAADELEKRGNLDEAGGREYLIDLVDAVLSPAGLSYHGRIVREKAVQRKLLETCMDLSKKAYEGMTESRELLDEAERRIFELARMDKKGEPRSVSDILNVTFEMIDRLREREGRLRGLGTGYYDLDDITGGLQPGELLILAGRPSMGKTSLALNLMERVAGSGHCVMLFSLEMSAEQVIQNMLVCRSQIDGQHLRKGTVTDHQYRRLQDEAALLYEAPLFVDDTPGISIGQLRGKARRQKQKHDIQLLIVDYLQLMSAGPRMESRQQEIATISRGLKAIARELEIPVLALSQLNRDVEGREDHRPRMSDLRESGAIEQDADVIMLLHREEYYKPTEENQGLAQLIIAKQRNGPTGEIRLRFFKDYMRFENYQRPSEPMH